MSRHVLIILLIGLLTACGQTGKLYLPEENVHHEN
jgi:predicted small lipoprotein YifL